MSGAVLSVIYTKTNKPVLSWLKDVHQVLRDQYTLSMKEEDYHDLCFDGEVKEWEVVPTRSTGLPAGFGRGFDTTVTVRGVTLYCSFDVYPEATNMQDESSEKEVSLTISFGSLLYSQLFSDTPSLRLETVPTTKKALLQLCFDIAGVTRASGFVIQTNDERRLASYTAKQLRETMLNPDKYMADDAAFPLSDPFFCAISQQWVSREELFASWGGDAEEKIKETISGYVYLDFP